MNKDMQASKLVNTTALACLEFALSTDIDDEIRKIDLDKIDEMIYPQVHKRKQELK